MNTEPSTRYSRDLPGLLFSLNLLYVGRFLLKSEEATPDSEACLTEIEAYIEAVSDELTTTELLHQAALLVGDVLPD